MTNDTSVIVVRHADELAPHIEAWEALAARAIEPNVFQEPWMLLPGWRAFGQGRDLRAVLIYGPNPSQPTAARVLYGLFVLERLRGLEGIPVAVMTTWQHDQAFLGTPLIREGAGPACLTALFDWLRTTERTPLMQFAEYGADGGFERVLTEYVNAHRGFAFSRSRHYRAVLERGTDAESVLSRAMSTGNRKELRRQARRLGETGTLEASALAPGDDVEQWIAQFLELERAGWKGSEQSALGSDATRKEFFEAICRAAHARGRLMLIRLSLDGRPIAMKCNFLALPGSFSFKIAFDEQLSRFSPGVQLELHNVAAVHGIPGWAWMDSCAKPDHFMIERLWADRRAISTMILATGVAPGGLVVSALPLLRWVYRTFIRRNRSRRNPAANPEATHEPGHALP